MDESLIRKLIGMSVDQLKYEYEIRLTNDKKIEDFKKGKEILDNFEELLKNGIDYDVRLALAIYAVYKLKGGK